MSADLLLTRQTPTTPLQPDQRADAAKLLARSFEDEPNFVDLFPTPRARRKALPALFGGLLADASAHGRIDVAWRGRTLAGIAVWFEPGTHPPTPTRQLRLLPALLRAIRAEPRAAPRLARFNRRLEALHPDRPHAYLAAIGTRPDLQQIGVGRTLLAAGLERADRSGVACYLEAQREATVAWYQRNDFVVQQVTTVLPGGATNWTMLRDARPT